MNTKIRPFAFALLTLTVAAQDSPTDPLVGFEGNWLMEFTNFPEKGKTHQDYISVARQWESYCNGKPFFATQSGAPPEGGNWTLRRILNSPLKGTGDFGEHRPPFATPLSLKHGYGYLGYWGGKSELRVTGPNEVRGTWTYGDKDGGTQVWKRMFPKVTAVEMDSQIKERVQFGVDVPRVQTDYSGPDNAMRGNRAGFQIRVFGDHLWGHHVCWIEGTDVEFRRQTHISAGKGSGKPHDVAGLLIEVVIWSKASPGRKILHVDGIQIPFDLIVKGFPGESAVPELRFVRVVNGKYEPAGELRHGDEFCVEAVYAAKPPQPPGKVQLSWTDGQPREVEVTATEDAKLFRSARLKLEAPAVK